MGGILLVFVVAIIFISLFSIGISRLLGRTVGKMISSKNMLVNEILETEKAPDYWTQHFRKKIETAQGISANNQAVGRLKRKAKNKFLKKLEMLINYYRNTTSVTEEARGALIDRLRQTYLNWKKSEWESIVLSQEERKKNNSTEIDTST